MKTKICFRCKRRKAIEQFSVVKRRGEKKPHSWCRKCQKEYKDNHYKENREAYAKNLRSHKERKRTELREVANDAKRVPCADCQGTFSLVVMDFDHVRGQKSFNIGAAVYSARISVARLEEEIAKCDVVCANCHRLRTHSHLAAIV